MSASNGAQPNLSVLRVIWVAICASVVIYAIVAFLVAGQTGAGDRGDPFSNPLVIALHLAGFAAVVAGFFLPAAILRGQQERDPNAPPPQPGAPFVLTRGVMQATILRFAMFESAAVMGLVLALVTGAWTLCLPLCLAALSALMLAFPAEEKLRALESGATGPF